MNLNEGDTLREAQAEVIGKQPRLVFFSLFLSPYLSLRSYKILMSLNYGDTLREAQTLDHVVRKQPKLVFL